MDKKGIGVSAGSVTAVNKQQLEAVAYTGFSPVEKGDVRVGVSIGYTITLGNYSSKTISVWMERPCDQGKEEQVCNEIIKWIEHKIAEKNEELRQMGKQMISLELGQDKVLMEGR
jgi:hypothetical protein